MSLKPAYSGGGGVSTDTENTFTATQSVENPAQIRLISEDIGTGNTATLSFLRNTDDRFYMNYRSTSGFDFRYTNGTGSNELFQISPLGVWTINDASGGGVETLVATIGDNTVWSATFQVDGDVGFYGTTPIAQQTGVAVSAAAIHTALVNLGLITA